MHFVDYTHERRQVVGSNQRLKPKERGVSLKIDDAMSSMNWLKKFRSTLDDDKLEYKDNEYESSEFDPLNLNIQDSTNDSKKDIRANNKNKEKHSFKDLDFDSLTVSVQSCAQKTESVD